MTVPLPFDLTAAALTDAMAEADPDSLAAATRLRARYGPDLATAALQQAALRRAARAKFADLAGTMFFTRAGLEQATRPEVAALHARRLVAAGATGVLDLGCGIGTDALAFAAAGLRTEAVEIDPAVAQVAAANLHGRATVVCADAADFAGALDALGRAVFCDPARRDTRGRIWRVEDFSPPWPFVLRLLDGSRPAGVKLGPALPHALIPDGVEAEWVSHRGTVVEVGLWSGAAGRPGVRTALVWPDARYDVHGPRTLPVRPPGDYLYEPDGAVIRAGGVGQLGGDLEAGLLDPHLAYLTGDRWVPTPFAAGFAVREVLPFSERVLRGWVREHGVGRLEIKRRGIDVDPAALRVRLRPKGDAAATVVISRTPRGAVALITDRVAP